MTTNSPPLLLHRDGVDGLIEALAADGYRVLGPVLREGTIVYDDVSSTSDLPQGWTDRQEPGHYRVERRADDALFGYVVGPHSWKRFLNPPALTLFRASRVDGSFVVDQAEGETQPLAFLGVRPCELAAISIQDRVFLQGDHVDPHYQRRRESALLIAVNCTEAASTCFCTSMGTGPDAKTGFDLALTEMPPDEDGHRFLLETGSARGAGLAARLSASVAKDEAVEESRARVDGAREQMSRTLEAEGLPEVLGRSHESPHWSRVGQRCLGCANCTMVCPTCFCSSVDDITELTGEAKRVRRWDSCFSVDFSYMHGGAVRSSVTARYRQWLTHKLGTWHEQFGTSGCVGCGRCITWCPVGIDITEEARALREWYSQTEGSDGSDDS